MTTLTVENNRTTARNSGEQDFTTVGFLHARRTAEVARAKVVAEMFGRLFSPKSKAVAAPAPMSVPADIQLGAFSLAEQERMARSKAIGETLATVAKGATSLFTRRAAAPAIDMSRFAHLSRHEQAEVERALVISEGISAILVGIERFVRDAIVRPIGAYLTRQRLMNELSGLSDRTLADIGVRRIDINTVAQDAYPIYMSDGSAAIDGAPANDDHAPRHVA